jgi:(E)-4-hydroxy-3-methylbut-2-enyl-diphosphate synthase
MIKRRKTRQVMVGHVAIGGDSPIVVQSMTNTDTRDVDSTVRQIRDMEAAGCEIVRVAVPDMKSAEALGTIVSESPIPVVADIHFSHRLALRAIEMGAAKIRINPGNIGGKDALEVVVVSAQEHGIPIRIGVNAGSLERDILDRYRHPTPEAMVESAKRNIDFLAGLDFEDIVVSIKSSDVMTSVSAYRKISEMVDYPLHLGITEAGAPGYGTVKSSVGLGALLINGIGDTIRVSLTGDPVKEIEVAYDILRSLHIRSKGPEIISCPTCGRVQIDLEALVEEVGERLKGLSEPVRVAILGCVVNGPGEAREADIGIAGGKGVGMLIREGEFIRRVPECELVDALIEEIHDLLRQRRGPDSDRDNRA